ncbi:MAG: hypothetical protein KDD10_09490 [Phaeodactylibacter sp.]|nr:hypothetical protein [Phaeodactylibacter sp.]MCB9298662.1 hypothetical protein [Lewinellaceae bacterium]
MIQFTRPFFVLLSFAGLFSCTGAPDNEEQQAALSAGEVLQRSIQFHDPQDKWPGAALRFVIDEPRIENPERLSEVFLNNTENTFSINRRYGNTLVTRGIIRDSCYSLVDSVLVNPADTATIRLHRLDCERTQGYRAFYKLLNGMPMSLYVPEVQLLPEVVEDSIRGQKALRIAARFTNPVIGEEWFIYFAPGNYQLLGYGYAAEGAGEILRLDGLVEIAGMKLPRMRHWYNRIDDSYLGSDIYVVVEEL